MVFDESRAVAGIDVAGVSIGGGDPYSHWTATRRSFASLGRSSISQ